MKGLWLLPTRRRVELVKRFFANAVANGLSSPGRILVQDTELAELRAEYDSISLPPGGAEPGGEARLAAAIHFPKEQQCPYRHRRTRGSSYI